MRAPLGRRIESRWRTMVRSKTSPEQRLTARLKLARDRARKKALVKERGSAARRETKMRMQAKNLSEKRGK